MKKIILLSTVFFWATISYAQHAGDLDSSFGTNGIVTLGSEGTYLTQSATQSDRKIVVTGYTYLNEQFHYFLVRYNIDGSVDNSFSEDGFLYTDFGIASLAIQSDGKIVAAGGIFLVRYNADGSVDNSFNENGIQYNDFEISLVAIQSDGKIVAAGGIFIKYTEDGYLVPALARYKSNGSIDSSFSGDGKQTTEFGISDNPISTSHYSLAIQTDGKIVMSGNVFELYNEYHYGGYIARYNIDGSLDKQKSIGIGVQGSIASMAMGSNNEIAMSGNTTYRWESTVVLLTLDPDDWSEKEFYVSNLGFDRYKVNIETNGKIILTGSIIARFNTQGGLDSSFSEDGIQPTTTEISNVTATVIAKNKLYVLGDNKMARYVLEEDIKTTPTVNITNPTDGASYTEPATITLSADATDKDGTIKTVDFYNGNKLIFSEKQAPFSRKWYNVRAGNYSITAKATDDSGNVTTSDIVNITVVPNKAPTVKITSPGDGASYTALATILLSADASDPDGKVKTVDFYSGTTLIFTETWPPFHRQWYNVPAGDYTITAQATDDKGLSTTSAPVHITVLGPNFLTANITSPGNGTSFTAPATITITADVKGPNQIMKTDFYNGNTLIFTEDVFPYSNKWRNVPAGNYSITAKATDNKGNVATSVPVAIIVKSPAFATVVSNKPASVNSKTKLSDAASVQLLPNPANNILNIKATGLQRNKQLTVSIISASGVTMQTKQLNSSIQLNVSSLVSGMYTIKFVSGDKVFYKQFIKL